MNTSLEETESMIPVFDDTINNDSTFKKRKLPKFKFEFIKPDFGQYKYELRKNELGVRLGYFSRRQSRRINLYLILIAIGNKITVDKNHHEIFPLVDGCRLIGERLSKYRDDRQKFFQTQDEVKNICLNKLKSSRSLFYQKIQPFLQTY